MTRVGISQPMYFPWAGFLAHMAMADVWLWLDDAQFSKGSFTNRIQVKQGSGRVWMSIPLSGKGSFTPIVGLKAAHDQWQMSHRDLLQQSLRFYDYKKEALALFDTAMTGNALCDQLIASSEVMAEAIGILPPTLLRTSSMMVGGISSMRVLELVKTVGGTHYITGHGAARYLDHDAFEKAGVAVSYMDYQPKPWPQKQGQGDGGQEAFTPYVTGLDLIAATGCSEAASYLQPATLAWRDFIQRQEGQNA
jgi:hypothetical protein